MIIYNTLTRKKEELMPQEKGKIKMFVCGPTVYDYIHLGNARTFVIFDMVAKWLRHVGYEVDYIQNITDIDNKIIERAQQEGVDPLEYAKKYSQIFKEDMLALGVTAPEYKNATEHILEVIKQVQTLLDKGHAYIIDGDGIYFDLSTFLNYGKLSGRTANMADDAVSRIDDSDKKRNRGDFALWKFHQDNDPFWPAPFGNGRPGWHIEDTAITEEYFGPQYDLHGGGQDLIFPHHEAEIAQQESASGLKPFVRYWMHTGFLVGLLEKRNEKEEYKKMSKSLGNFTTLHEALKTYSKETLRFYFISAHYRSTLALTEQSLKASEAAVQRLGEFWSKIQTIAGSGAKSAEINEEITEKTQKAFIDSMNDDFNTPDAFGHVFNLIREVNPLIDAGKIGNTLAIKISELLSQINTVLGVVPVVIEEVPHEVQNIVKLREELRQDKDFAGADKLRDQIESAGYQVDDTSYGPLIKKR